MRSHNWRLEQLEREDPRNFNIPTEFRVLIYFRGGEKEMFVIPLTAEGKAEAERLKANDPDESFKADWVPANIWYGVATQNGVRADWNPIDKEIVDGLTGSFPMVNNIKSVISVGQRGLVN